MGRKRNHSDSSDKENKESAVLKRIRRLERKLKHKKKRQHRRKHSSDSDSSIEIDKQGRHDYTPSKPANSLSSDTNQRQLRMHSWSDSENSSRHETSQIRSQGGDENNKTSETIQVQALLDANPNAKENQLAGEKSSEPVDDPLGEEVLNAIGKRFAEGRILAPAIHKDMASRWEEILKLGLPSEDRVAIIKKYPPPSNCTLIDPPKLNLEVRSSLQEAILKRDGRILSKQEKLTACLGAIGKTLSILFKNGYSEENLLLIECLGDTSRLLADLQHDETVIRRSLLLSNINTNLKNTLSATPIDEWLFGKELAENVKAAKLIENSAKDFKPAGKPQIFKQSKNWKGPLRQQRPKNPQTITSGQKYPTAFSSRASRPQQSQRTSQRKDNSSYGKKRY